MTKELLTIRFDYRDKPISNQFTEWSNKTITIGIYDTLEEAIIDGNKAIEQLSKKFEVRKDNYFSLKGSFGRTTRFVTNNLYPTKGISFSAKIQTLKFEDLSETIEETFRAFERYKKYKQE